MSIDPYVAHIAVAMLVGTIIGLERQITHHPAGLRTNALVSLGAALFVALQRQYLQGNPPFQIPIAAQIVSGVGFLGAGLIMKEGLNVKGMNTAATLWCSAALGSLSGGGYWSEALIGCGAVLTLNSGYIPLVHFLERRTALSGSLPSTYQTIVTCHKDAMVRVRDLLTEQVRRAPNVTLRGLSVAAAETGDRVTIQAAVYAPIRNDAFLEALTCRLGTEEGVRAVSWSREA